MFKKRWTAALNFVITGPVAGFCVPIQELRATLHGLQPGR